MIKLSVFSVIAVTAALVVFPAKSASAAESADSRTSHFTCSLDVSFRANDASASIVSGTTRGPDSEEPLKSKKAADKSAAKTDAKIADSHHANLIGRGVANCKNEQGFQFNLPTVMSISIDSEEKLPLDAIRATLEPLSVARDVNKIFDRYAPHIELRNTPSTGANSSSDRAVVVKGSKNDVLMQINLNVPAEFSAKVNVARVDLKFDSATQTK